jgi:hypothetical protein
MKKNCTEEYCECVHLLKVGLGETIELVMIDEGQTYNANHPMHRVKCTKLGPLVLLGPKFCLILWLSNLSTLSVPDEGYSRTCRAH